MLLDGSRRELNVVIHSENDKVYALMLSRTGKSLIYQTAAAVCSLTCASFLSSNGQHLKFIIPFVRINNYAGLAITLNTTIR